MATTLTLGQLASQLGCELRGDADISVSGIGSLSGAGTDQVSFLANPKYLSQLAGTSAAAVLVTPEAAEHCPVNALVCKDPYLSYAKLSRLFEPAIEAGEGVHSTAVIDSSATIAADARIGPYAVIGRDCHVGTDAVIGPHCVLENNSSVGSNSVLRSGVTLYRDCKVGNDCLIHSGVVIGADGFGIAWSGSGWEKIAQLGSVVIHNDVEIGANTTIDRGAIDDTVISDGVRLDNLIQIGHNCRVGKNTAIAGQAGMAGSTNLGENCLVGGQVGISGHLTIANGVQVMQDNGVLVDITEPGQYTMGFGTQPAVKSRRTAVRLKQLDDMARTLRALEKRLTKIETGPQ